ncbi:MAG: cyclic nucleotide-binding domain-containing protein [Gammaproteobacteria bacterium]|nr:cyclic nucleotide-binding domain-containing protein [Gammaproteobacteria bacterium]
MHQAQKVLAIKNVTLFQGLPSSFLLALAEEAEVVELPAKQVIFAEGDLPTGMYVLVYGKVKITRDGGVLADLKEHDYFGELALLDSSSRTATATTCSNVLMLYIDKYLFDNILNNFPNVMLGIAKSIISYM